MTSSQEPLGQFQPNLETVIQICSNKGAGPFWGPKRGQIRKKIVNLKNSSSQEPLAGVYLLGPGD